MANRTYYGERLESRAIAAMDGNTSDTKWDLRGIKSRAANGQVKYLVGICYDIVLPVISAASASAVNGLLDTPLFLKGHKLTRASGASLYNGMAGWDMAVRDACVGLGYLGSKMPANIAVNANATTTQRFRWFMPIGDDGLLAPEGERYYHAWPFAAFIGSNGQLELSWGQPTGHTGITTGAGTVRPTLIYILRDEAYLPPDRRFGVVSTATTGTVRGLEFPAGLIESVVYAPFELGGELLTDAVIDGEQYEGYGFIFPRRDAVGDDITVAPSANSPSYQEAFLSDSGELRLNDADASALNLIMERRVVPCWLPVRAKQTQRFFEAPGGFKLDVEITTATANGHRFQVGTFSTDTGILATDIDIVCAELGIPKSRLVVSPWVREGRAPSEALPASRRAAIGTKLTDTAYSAARAAVAARR